MKGSRAIFVLVAIGFLAATQPSEPPPAWAQTPTPTITPAPPVPDESSMEVFVVTAWVDARPGPFTTVAAFVGDTLCAEAEGILIPEGSAASYFLTIPSSEEKPGCGEPGATVRFMIGDREAAETLTWEAGAFKSVTLTSGPPFAQYYGNLTYDILSDPTVRVVPVIGDTVCGKQTNPWVGQGPTYGYHVVVDPAELTPGCGVPGAVVRFWLVRGVAAPGAPDAPRIAVAEALGTAVWQPGAREEIDLAFPLTPLESLPEAGTGGDAGFGEYSWWVVGAILVAVGAALMAAGGWGPRRQGKP